jgi:hypothetical protein
MLWHNLLPCPLKICLKLYVTHFWQFGEFLSFLSANAWFSRNIKKRLNQAFRNMAKCILPSKNPWRFANKTSRFFGDLQGILRKIRFHDGKSLRNLSFCPGIFIGISFANYLLKEVTG